MHCGYVSNNQVNSAPSPLSSTSDDEDDDDEEGVLYVLTDCHKCRLC